MGRHRGPGLDLGHRAARRYGRAYGAEQAGKGHNVALAPTINILRLPTVGPRAGDVQRGPVPDRRSRRPPRSAAIQSQHVIATAKHFVANNQEVLRSSINVVAGQQARKEIYEPAFKAAVQQAGAGAIMCSYNRVNGTYACENADELTDTLRDAWKFDGMVMSDWGALHSTVKAARVRAGPGDARRRRREQPQPRSTSSSASVLQQQAQGRRAVRRRPRRRR